MEHTTIAVDLAKSVFQVAVSRAAGRVDMERRLSRDRFLAYCAQQPPATVVVDGRVELDGELPEGASVTVIARDDDETFEADPAAEKMLLEAIAQCERGDTVPMTKSVLSKLAVVSNERAAFPAAKSK